MTTHQPVLLQELIDTLDPQPGDVVVDATLGGGGHALELAERIGPSGTLVGIDLDEAALARVKERLGGVQPTAHFVCASFRDIDQVLLDLSIPYVNCIVMDLGYSSDQLERSGRGFSFQRTEPLVMTLASNPNEGDTTAHDIVNDWDELHIADILHGFGEERFARRIARAIAEARRTGPIETTTKLVEIVERAVPAWYRARKIHPATKTFQALRIAVNDELGALENGISKGIDVLAAGGRIAIITFHSIEDRVVKQNFRAHVERGHGSLVHKKPITPTATEIAKNPRARSAKLRTFQKQ